MKIVAFVVLGIQLVSAIALTIVAAGRHDKNMALLFSLCLLASHASLLGIWAALSTVRWHWRLSTIVFGGAILATEFSWSAKLTATASLLVAATPIACLFTVLTVRAAKTRFVLLDPAELATQKARPQFTIKHMLAFTTIVAVLISATRVLPLLRNESFNIVPVDRQLEETLEMATFSFCAVPAALVCFSVAFSIRGSWQQWVAIFVVPAVVGILPELYRRGPEWWIFILVSYVELVLVGAILWPVRMCGYRMVRHNQPTESAVQPRGDLLAHPLD